MAHLLGYARVSTTEQNPDLQVDELTAAGCWKVWTDHASGSLDRRPQLDEVLEQLRPGDTLVVWRLDRLGRSLRHLIDTVTGLDERGVGFRSLRESIDTTTAGGRLVFHLFGALAQFEREIIRDRTVAGLAAARARGRVGGRPSKLSAEQRRQARRMYDARELTVEQIGQVLGVRRTSRYSMQSPVGTGRRWWSPADDRTCGGGAVTRRGRAGAAVAARALPGRAGPRGAGVRLPAPPAGPFRGAGGAGPGLHADPVHAAARPDGRPTGGRGGGSGAGPRAAGPAGPPPEPTEAALTESHSDVPVGAPPPGRLTEQR